MRISIVSVLLAALAVASCGAKKSDNVNAKDEAAKAEGAKLPATVLVRVPVDASGKELNAQAEMRLLDSAAQLDKDNVAATFDSAAKPAKTIDELDSTSSTESFCGWLGLGFGYASYGYAGYAGYNWGYYRPTYYNYGYNYNYNYGGAYNSYGYNYHSYNQGFGGYGYNSYGWNPGSSYSYGGGGGVY